MSAEQAEAPVRGGVLSGLDFGGRGTNVLLVRGSGSQRRGVARRGGPPGRAASGNHNVPMTRPAELAVIIRDLATAT
ncbi:hypothetical protein SAMN02982929_03249 [Saccharopolyspora kobensis]|uniref:Uncharacterized protein n=1 Tax=Saccharopolyspora kobensis TaxID=146035 RepID=A0A1H6CAF3_9PSEU|nr:hypothetical protein [Saccharopolyspora kobensis]SEG69605.1 hypothetical protein SAMN02982929_03249 [Saccharopolyspora kobensis]SFC33065.1 hypothetical protein SAMN05216506_101491 [Saccharopolyspora kobensis]